MYDVENLKLMDLGREDENLARTIEIEALVESNGVDVMPEDFSERLARIEEVIEKVKRFFAAASENVLLSSIMQAIEEKEDGDSL